VPRAAVLLGISDRRDMAFSALWRVAGKTPLGLKELAALAQDPQAPHLAGDPVDLGRAVAVALARAGADVACAARATDDAPLSLGQSMLDGVLSRCRVRVVVVFGRTNWTRWAHPTQGRARPVTGWRRAEETAASLAFGYRFRVDEARDAGESLAERTAWAICSGEAPRLVACDRNAPSSMMMECWLSGSFPA
jgi:hypothetical protein